MQNSFWINKWRKAEIGFHQENFHPVLDKHFPKLATNSKVLVPLCGKSKDMLWLLNQAYQVFGVELVESAVVDFFVENCIAYQREESANFISFIANELPLCLFVGDFFAITSDQISSCDALYDRAALIALPPDLRAGYTQQCQKLIKPDARVCLINLYYDETNKSGPPFSISEDEIEILWKGRLQRKDSISLLKENSPFGRGGFEFAFEETWIG